ncbi:MAG: hypothetical protein J6U54_24825 [Clostridiales bacterium]|nr:hypothetical protein [Clostridiales bacterium]
MRKETITYEDFDGNEKTKDLYFHLTEAEITVLNLTENGRYASFEQKDAESNMADTIRLFEKLIQKAYGQKTEDGTFIKSEKAKEAFLCSPEYSELLTKFISGEINPGEFIIDCLPKKLSKKIDLKDGQIKLLEDK